MRYLSVCSGIEAATMAWHPLGWEPLAFSEIEPFPSAVLAHHYPHVPNLGDMTRFAEWPDAAIDLLVGGTPCQSFSIAGLRGGLRDPRGQLALAYAGIAQRYRPRWIVWENVPGVLSSHGGRDFGTFLGALAFLGYGFAWRVLDAQYVRTRRFGRAVPQTRRRVFVVGHLGDWRPAASVLFDGQSLSGHPPPRRGTRGEDTGGSRPGAAGGGGLVVMAHGQANAEITHDFSPTLTCNHEAPVVAFAQNGDAELSLVQGDGQVVGALTGGGGKPGQGYPAIAIDTYNQSITGAVSHTVRASGQGDSIPAIVFNARQDPIPYGDVSGPLDTDGGTIGVTHPKTIRRLTPRECERLQGFPDDFTLIPWVRKAPGLKADDMVYRAAARPDLDEDALRRLSPDSARYAALGNSMAVNVMEWLGERIAMVERGDWR